VSRPNDDLPRGAGAGQETSAVRPDPHPPSALVVDVGSTATKVATLVGDRLTRLGRAPTRAASWPDLLAGHDELGSVGLIAVAAASPEPVERLGAWWHDRFGTTPPIRTVAAGTAPLPVDYDPPSALGADRIADAVAAVAGWGAPVVVVDAGTAITCDLVDGAGRFAGGAIAPGPCTAYRGLVERIPHLGLARGLPPDGDLPLAATTTYDAVRVGVTRGAAALVDSLVAGYRSRVGAAPVVVTGGLGPTVARHCRADTAVTAVDPDLTLRGIYLACSLAGTGTGALSLTPAGGRTAASRR
jgi:type III pantothenate kinase